MSTCSRPGTVEVVHNGVMKKIGIQLVQIDRQYTNKETVFFSMLGALMKIKQDLMTEKK